MAQRLPLSVETVETHLTPDLHSVQARKRLVLLVAALEARPGRDHRELDRMAWEVAAVRPA